MTRDDLRAFLQTIGHGTDAQSVAAQNSALQLAFYQVCSRRAWSWLRKNSTAGTLTPGTATVPLPADLAYPVAVRLSYGNVTHEPLEELRPELIDAYLAQDLGTGEPVYWCWRNQQLVVYPRPDLAYAVSLDYVRDVAETEFDSDADAIPFDDRFHPVIAWVAAATLALRQRDQVQYNIAKNEAEQLLLLMERADRESDDRHVAHWTGWGLVKG